MSRRLLVVTMSLGAAALLACGLDAVGEFSADEALPSSVDVDSGTSDSDGPDETPSPDAATPASPDAADAASPPPPCVISGTTCTEGLSDGWRPVMLLEALEVSCPPGYSARDLFTGTASDDACDCTATPSTDDPPSCEREPQYTARLGNFVFNEGCTIAHDPYDVDTGKCVPLALTDIARNGGRFPKIQHKGKCELTCTGDVTKVPKEVWRTCEPSAECTETACLGASAPSGGGAFTYCLEHDDEVGCPGDDAGAFRRIVASTTLSVSCTGGSCENDIQCGDGAVHVFGTDDCSGEKLTTIPANEQCLALKDGARTFKYTATTVSAKSTPKDPAHAQILHAGTKTLCCPNAAE